MTSAKELGEELDTDLKVIRRWVKEGLPTKKKRPLTFDHDEAISWLEANKKIAAVEVERILVTRDDVAKHFNVNVRTVGHWLKEPDFPGRAGSPGMRDGYFPVDQIQEWRSERGPDYEDSELNQKIKLEKYRKIKLENDKEAGRLVERHVVEEWIAESMAILKQVLRQTQNELVGVLPSTLTKKQRTQCRKQIEASINKAQQSLADGFQEEADK